MRVRQFLKRRIGEELDATATEGPLIQRVLSDLTRMKGILDVNDEAHHCHRSVPKLIDDEDLQGEKRQEAETNNRAARIWIAGIEAVNRKLGLCRVIDLSATQFFLRGSGHAEGTLSPWMMAEGSSICIFGGLR
jgi:type III restriction enzyme